MTKQELSERLEMVQASLTCYREHFSILETRVTELEAQAQRHGWISAVDAPTMPADDAKAKKSAEVLAETFVSVPRTLLEALQADQKRLDWLEKKGYEAFESPYCFESHKSLWRETIDRFMKQRPLEVEQTEEVVQP